VFERVVAGDVGDELQDRAAAVDVHELAPEADAEGRHPPPLDLGEQGQLERLAVLVDRDRLRVPRFAVQAGSRSLPPLNSTPSSASTIRGSGPGRCGTGG
jgi:hypothetical protein